MTRTMGIDVGTYGSKGVVVEEGRVLAEAATSHRLRVPRAGWAEHDPEADWWAGVAAIARRLSEEAGPVEALAVSAIGPCVVPVDEDGRPLCDAILYGVDTRAAREIADLTERLGPQEVRRRGDALTAQSVGPKIAWLARHRPGLHAAAARFATASSWLVHRLTGEWAVDLYTAAGFAPLWDAERGGYVADLTDVAEPHRLAPPMAATAVAGRVTEAAAAETGLRAGTPVTAGTVDAAAEAVGVGVRAPGDLMVMLGSTVFAIAPAEARPADPRLWSAPWLLGGHAAMAGLATSGTLTHWFRERFARELPEAEAFARLAEEAASSPPGARGLLLLPYFSGERTPLHDPLARGAWFGLDLTHGRGDLYRALLEGIAFATRHALETFAEAGVAVERAMAVGGGARNRVWLQATADAAGLDLRLRRVATGAAYGDAFLAALAVGAAEPSDIERWNPVAEIVRARRVAAYERQYPLFRRLYERTSDVMAALAQG